MANLISLQTTLSIQQSLENSRGIIEKLCEFSEHITPFDPAADGGLFTEFRKKHARVGQYGPSLAYVTQVTRDLPLKYYDGENFSVMTARKYGTDVLAVSPFGSSIDRVLENMGAYLYSHNLSLCVSKVYREGIVPLLLARNFKRLSMRSPKIGEDRPDDIFPERIINTSSFSLRVLRHSAQLTQKARKIFGRSFSSAQLEQTFLSSLLGLDNRSNVTVSVTNASKLRKKQVREISELLKRWGKIKSEHDSASGINVSPVELAAPYEVLLENLSFLKCARVMLVRREETGTLVGCVLLDKTANGTQALVMNIADRTIPQMSIVTLLLTIEMCKVLGLDFMYLALGGSESQNLDRFKRQVSELDSKRTMAYRRAISQRSITKRSWYMMYDPKV